MIPQREERSVIQGGVLDTTSFGINAEDTAWVLSILRDQLYTDSILAVLREYSSNAMDAHKECGKHDVPIKITLPTQDNPTLIIEDQGPGLSHEDVFSKFVKYGSSTKRASDTSIGMMGIGCKSAFAYTDTFTVVSCHGGMRRTYVAFIDPSERGAINLLAEEPCGDTTGLTIKVGVRQSDIGEFEGTAQELFRFFDPLPNINTQIDSLSDIKIRTDSGIIFEKTGNWEDRYNEGKWHAVMGGIPYSISFDQIKDQPGIPLLLGALGNHTGVLFFDIGEVEVSASREELKYTDDTKKKLGDKFGALFDEFVLRTMREAEALGTSWDRRLACLTLGKMHLGRYARELIVIDGDIGSWTSDNYIQLTFKPDMSFRVMQRNKVAGTLTIHQSTRIVLRDDTRSIYGFDLRHYDYVLSPLKGKSVDDVLPEFEEYCRENRLDGIPVVRLSTMGWTARPKNAASARVNGKVFKLANLGAYDKRHSNSSCWDPVAGTPGPEHIYVIFGGFYCNTCDGINFFEARKEDEAIAELVGVKLPPLYGYRDLMSRPVNRDKIIGIPYKKWRDEWLSGLVNSKILETKNSYDWARAIKTFGFRPRITKGMVCTLRHHLGEDDPLVEFVTRHYECRRRGINPNMNRLIHKLTNTGVIQHMVEGDTQPARLRQKVFSKYPLLAKYGLEELGKPHSLDWLHYFKSVAANGDTTCLLSRQPRTRSLLFTTGKPVPSGKARRTSKC